ncbi:MAG: hypothetical protein AMXMBFR36_04120 [Acidobacteriota bacterium]
MNQTAATNPRLFYGAGAREYAPATAAKVAGAETKLARPTSVGSRFRKTSHHSCAWRKRATKRRG